MSATVKLQGGPCDGIVRQLTLDETPPRLWAKRCPECGAHVFTEEVAKAEVYRKDEEKESHTLYVFTDSNLGGSHPYDQAMVGTPEKVGVA